MSTESKLPAQADAPGPAAGDALQVLCLAFGVAATVVVAELFAWNPTFLAPLIALQFLVCPGPPPSLLQAFVVLATVTVATGIMEVLTNILLGHVAVLALVLWLVLFLSFFAHFRGAPGIVTLLLQISTIAIPVLSITSSTAAVAFREALIAAVIIAFLVVWIAHAMFPAGQVTATAEEPIRLEPDAALRQALIATLILMPMLVWYLLDASQVAVVLLIVLLIVVRVHEPAKGRLAALGLIIGNIGGGIAAVIVYHLIIISHSTLLFALLVLLACLLFASRLAVAGQSAPIYAIAFGTFILLLASGLSPISGGSEEAFASRLVNVLIGTAYAVATLSIAGQDTPSSNAPQARASPAPSSTPAAAPCSYHTGRSIPTRRCD